MKTHRRLALLSLSLLACLPTLSADDQSSVIKQPPTSQYNAAVSKLSSAPKRKYEFVNALLGDILRFVAADAGITLRSLPEDSPEYNRSITITLDASPFQLLSTLCRNNALPLILDGNTWYVRPTDDQQQVTRDYEPARDHIASLAKDEIGPPTIGSGLASRHDEIATDLRSILDLPPANISKGPEDAATAPKVTWKPHSDTLHIVATRLQHLWVQAYLSTFKKGWKVSGENGSQELSANSR